MGSCHSTEDAIDIVYYAKHLIRMRLIDAEHFVRLNTLYYDEKSIFLIKFIVVYQKNNVIVNKSFSDNKGRGYTIIVNVDKNDIITEIVKLL